MSGFVCPSCGHHEEIFLRGGGRKLAERAAIEFLGDVPLEPAVSRAGDEGTPVVICTALRGGESSRAWPPTSPASSRSGRPAPSREAQREADFDKLNSSKVANEATDGRWIDGGEPDHPVGTGRLSTGAGPSALGSGGLAANAVIDPSGVVPDQGVVLDEPDVPVRASRDVDAPVPEMENSIMILAVVIRPMATTSVNQRLPSGPARNVEDVLGGLGRHELGRPRRRA